MFYSTTPVPMKEKISSKDKTFRILLGTTFLLLLFVSLSFAQPRMSGSSVLLPEYIKRHAHEVPPKRVEENVMKYDHLIKYFTSLSYSRAGVRVNANFIRALMSAESGGDQYALSNKDAIGLTQITYETGRTAALELYKMKFDFEYVDEKRLKDLQPSDLYDPAINILICTYLIDKYNANYGGNLALTISAWNAGPGSISQYKGYPPYEETLTLIARVNSYLRHYMRYYL